MAEEVEIFHPPRLFSYNISAMLNKAQIEISFQLALKVTISYNKSQWLVQRSAPG